MSAAFTSSLRHSMTEVRDANDLAPSEGGSSSPGADPSHYSVRPHPHPHPHHASLRGRGPTSNNSSSLRHHHHHHHHGHQHHGGQQQQQHGRQQTQQRHYSQGRDPGYAACRPASASPSPEMTKAKSRGFRLWRWREQGEVLIPLTRLKPKVKAKKGGSSRPQGEAGGGAEGVGAAARGDGKQPGSGSGSGSGSGALQAQLLPPGDDERQKFIGEEAEEAEERGEERGEERRGEEETGRREAEESEEAEAGTRLLSADPATSARRSRNPTSGPTATASRPPPHTPHRQSSPLTVREQGSTPTLGGGGGGDPLVPNGVPRGGTQEGGRPSAAGRGGGTQEGGRPTAAGRGGGTPSALKGGGGQPVVLNGGGGSRHMVKEGAKDWSDKATDYLLKDKRHSADLLQRHNAKNSGNHAAPANQHGGGAIVHVGYAAQTAAGQCVQL